MYLGLKNNKPVGWSNEPIDGYIEVSQEQYDFASLNPDCVWDGEKLVVPVINEVVEPFVFIPQQVSMRQARLVLLQMGLLSQIDTIVSQMGDVAKIEWEYASVIEKTNPLVASMGMTVEQLDNMFLVASKL